MSLDCGFARPVAPLARRRNSHRLRLTRMRFWSLVQSEFGKFDMIPTRLRSIIVQIVATFTVIACGGGGDSLGVGGANTSAGATAGASGSQECPVRAPRAGTADPSGPPASGPFGGGQGKIVYVDGGTTLPRCIFEIDLMTRAVRDVAAVSDNPPYWLQGGVSRADDGSFIVSGWDPTQLPVITDYTTGALSEAPLRPKIFYFRADGSLAQSYSLELRAQNGAAISADGKSIAFARSTNFGSKLEAVLIDIGRGETTLIELLGSNDAPRDKSTLSARPVWSATSRLYFLSGVGLHRVEAGHASIVHRVALRTPGAAIFSPDERVIFFDQAAGNARGTTVWSMDVATGSLTRRSIRSQDGFQSAPALSPDGQWMIMQEADFADAESNSTPALGPPSATNGLAQYVPTPVSAVRLADAPLDTQGRVFSIRDAAGFSVNAHGQMAWY